MKQLIISLITCMAITSCEAPDNSMNVKLIKSSKKLRFDNCCGYKAGDTLTVERRNSGAWEISRDNVGVDSTSNGLTTSHEYARAVVQ